MRVKICGVTRVEDALLAESLGAHEIGCVVVPESPRSVPLAGARRIFESLNQKTVRVLVFRDAHLEEVEEAAMATGCDVVQLHRTSLDVSKQLKARGLSVRRIQDLSELHSTGAEETIFLDHASGGTGETLDWNVIPKTVMSRAMIAGGLSPESLPDLLMREPYGIDVSSKIESSPGIKCARRLRELFDVVKRRQQLCTKREMR